MSKSILGEQKIKEMQTELKHIEWSVNHLWETFLIKQKELDSYRKFMSRHGDTAERSEGN